MTMNYMFSGNFKSPCNELLFAAGVYGQALNDDAKERLEGEGGERGGVIPCLR